MRKKLLVIDDEPAITRLIKRIAETCGFAALATSDPLQFKQEVAGGDPDVICLDLAMPYVDGIEVLGFLAARNCQSRLLIISGFDAGLVSSALRLAQSRGLNVVGTISKPIRIDVLREQLLAIGQEG